MATQSLRFFKEHKPDDSIPGTIAIVKCHLIFLLPVLDFIKESGRGWIMTLSEIALSPRLLSSLVVICSSENQYDKTYAIGKLAIHRHPAPAEESGWKKVYAGFSAEKFQYVSCLVMYKTNFHSRPVYHTTKIL